MSTEYSETDCSTTVPVPNNEPPKGPVMITLDDPPAADSRDTSPRSSEYEAVLSSIGSSIPESTLSSGGGASLESSEAATNATSECDDFESKICSPRDLEDILPLEDYIPRAVRPIQAADNNESMFNGRFTGPYRAFMMKIRNSPYFKIGREFLLLAFSISGLYLGRKFINNCYKTFELVFILVLSMGGAGVLSFLFRFLHMATARFGTVCEWMMLDHLAQIYLVVFLGMAIAEEIVMIFYESYTTCKAFNYYLGCLNAGLFLSLLLEIFIYVDVIVDALDPTKQNSLLTRIRRIYFY
ncbi:hypothetical protein NPIL_198221 [Nephila pilipes]|uniref:Uncharacterized protein n=1 Tax=Nephila pilipes TaxID=299642 RepID=A0A8X6PNR4_NEPPI|nr:hypothetical protein NPIL_198221 [Nephila pilipes]